MGALVSIVSTGLTFCCCSAASSLCSSCLGNDKPHTEAPSATSGRKRSVLLLAIALALSFAFQYGVAPKLVENASVIQTIPKVGRYLVESWTGGCLDYPTEELQIKCSGNNGVYRVAAATWIFFVIAAIAAACKPVANRLAWPAKYALFLFLVAGTVFIPNEPLFSPIFMQLARIGGAIFIFFQQIILIDLAYNLNESWVQKADDAEKELDGSGKKWLGAILAMCAILFIGSLAVIGTLYAYFSGCATNTAFITVTLIVGIIVTVVQLNGEEASLLTSAVIFAYAVYLLFTAVSKNPDGTCNPKLGENDVLGIVLGICFALISLSWAGWSYTAAHKLGEATATSVDNDRGSSRTHNVGEGDEDAKVVTGVVVNSDYGTNGDKESEDLASNTDSDNVPAKTWKLNIVLSLISCYFAMTLTTWGAVESGGDVANPDVGRVSMWMIIASQWLALALYLWTLVAPKLFPDRDFS